MAAPPQRQEDREPKHLQIAVPERKLAPTLSVCLAPGRLELREVVLEAIWLVPRWLIGLTLRR
jgi:hypothetical protein